MTAYDSAKTHCPAGHLYDDENTYVVPSTGERRCRRCARAGSAESSRRYRDRHPERVVTAQRAYRERNRAKTRAAGRVREQDRRERERLAVIDALGGKCHDCGFDDRRALEIDHVNDDGTVERVRFNGNFIRFWRTVIAEADSGRYQLLCRNCNGIKEWERRRAARRGAT